MNDQRHFQRPQNQDGWIRAKRVFAVVVAVALWIASMQFSFAGFSFNMESMTWLGWVLAIAVTAIELVFNTDIRKLNLTLFVAGLIAYTYGVATNVIGFYSAQGGTIEKLYAHPESILFAILVGAFLEIVPEPLFIWGLGVDEGGDFIANLFRGNSQINSGRWTGINQTQPMPPQNFKRPQQPPPGPPHIQKHNQPTNEYQRIVNARNQAKRKDERG